MNEKGNLNTKEKVISGLFWKFMERGGTQGIQFVVQLILARILVPEDYGVVALITIFIAVANVFVQNGFSQSLIQKKYINEIDYSSVFYLNLFVSIILYSILFFLAPFISNFYEEPELILIIRTLSVTLFFGAVNSVQNAIVSRTMKFKRFFFSSLGGIIGSGIVGIIMAYAGQGAWALVWQQITNNMLITIILWFTIRWRPKLLFSFSSIKILFNFGWKLLCSSLIDTLYNNIYGLVIGKVYNPLILAYYNRGDQFPKLIVTNINGSISSVLFPVMAANQDNNIRMKKMVQRSIKTSSFIIFPVMIGLAACSDPLVKIILTDKWLPSVPFLQLMCISYAFWPIHTANLQAINAMGRSDIFLKLEIIKKFIGIAVLCISIPFGVYVMSALKVFTAFISSIINSFPNRKLLNYGYKEQLFDICPALIISLVMGVIVNGIRYIGWNDWVTLFVQLLTGIVSYLGLSLIFKLESFTYLLNTLKQVARRK